MPDVGSARASGDPRISWRCGPRRSRRPCRILFFTADDPSDRDPLTAFRAAPLSHECVRPKAVPTRCSLGDDHGSANGPDALRTEHRHKGSERVRDARSRTRTFARPAQVVEASPRAGVTQGNPVDACSRVQCTSSRSTTAAIRRYTARTPFQAICSQILRAGGRD